MTRRTLLSLAAAACAGCASRSGAPRPAAPAAPAVNEYTVREVPFDGLTVRLEIPPGPPGRRAAVVAHLPEANSLRAAGFIAVSFVDWRAPKEAPPPAESAVGKWVLASPSAGVLGREYFRVIARLGTEVVPKVIDYLVTDSDVDPTRIGITGGSTNGFVAFEAVAADKRIAAAAVQIACGDYHEFLRGSSMGMEGRPLALDREYDRWLRDHEPISHPDRLVHAALLMVNQEADTLIPIRCAVSTARVLEKAYARAKAPERFRSVRVPDGGHGVGELEGRETIAWLVRWLRPK